MTDAGRHGLGVSYPLTFDTTTFSTHRRNHALEYLTTADRTVQTFDASAWAVGTAIMFAGIALIDIPHVNVADVQTSSWASEDYSSQYDDAPGPHKYEVTVLHRCRTDAIASETISPGDPLMMTDTADGTLYEHDGMLKIAAVATANEMYACMGMAESGATVVDLDTHDDTWDADLGTYTGEHPSFWVQLWR